MLKQSISAICRWFSPKQTTLNPPLIQDNETCVARRQFFKRTAIGAASATGTAGLAKMVVDSAPQPDMKEFYAKDSLAGEQELMKREYVLMSDKEKSDMVQTFIDNSSKQS